MKKRLIPVIVLLLAAGAGTLYWHREKQEDHPGRLTLYGNADVRVVNLAFEASGRITAMPIQEGGRVSKGEVLAHLDTRRLSLARDAAKSQVAAQGARLAELEAGARPEEIAKLRADLELAGIQAANARRNAERVRGMATKKLASPQQLDDARTAANAASARVRSTQAALDLALAGSRAEDIAAAKATLAALEADLALAQRNLDDAVLYAPSGGVVQSRILEPGDMASPERPVYTLAVTDPLWARVYIPETELGKVKPGLPATVRSDSFPDKTYRGWVGYVSPSAEFTPKSVETTEIRTDLVYQARVYLCDPLQELRQGMPVTVTLDLTAQPEKRPGCGEQGAAANPAAPETLGHGSGTDVVGITGETGGSGHASLAQPAPAKVEP